MATGRSAALLLAAAALAGGCAQVIQTHTSGATFLDTNHVTFEYPFDARSEAIAAGRAEEQCRSLKRVAIRTSRSCSLERCRTSWQCMKPEDAEKFQNGSRK